MKNKQKKLLGEWLANLKHQNNGNCPKCKELFDAFPNFDKKVRGWFILFQAKHPEAHISCAGRGFKEQEDKKLSGNSNAHYGQSAHNYNCAIDLFVQLPNVNLYDKDWFKKTVAAEVPYFLNWYGTPDAAYPELPHIELREWRGLKSAGQIALVETIPDDFSTGVA